MAGVLVKNFEDRYMLSNIKSERHRKLFETALQYHRELKDLKKPYFSKKRRELQDIVKQIEDNIEEMYHLASILNLIFDEDSIFQQHIKSLPQQIAKVKIKIGRTSNEVKLKDLNHELHLLG
jgi:predicted  nucleic acid-binding Zn-ribbon protein